MSQTHIADALDIIRALGFPPAQQNERSALCLLALLNLTPKRTWAQAENPLIGITPIMQWVREHYANAYAANSREGFRKQTIHQFCAAGIARHNPDQPNRAVNSPYTVYQIEAQSLNLLRRFGQPDWLQALAHFQSERETLLVRYAKERQQNRLPVQLPDGQTISLSPGEHSELIRAIIQDFAPRFAPGSRLIYAGDTGGGFFDAQALAQLGVVLDTHGKMPDVVLHFIEKNWLILIESVTTHGPVDGKRHAELANLFASSSAGLVYVTAFPNRPTMARFLSV